MGLTTKISWATATCNIWWGCVEISILCDKCYAREWAKRYDRAKWGADEPRLAVKGVWSDLETLQRRAAKAGEVHRVFCGSMMDIFEKPMPVVSNKGEKMDGTTDDLRRRLFNEVVPASPNLLFLLLTKRPGNIPKYVPPEWLESPPANVMYGTSVGDQETFDLAVPHLRRVPGRKFLSIEPLLGPICCRPTCDTLAEKVAAIDDGSAGRPTMLDGIEWGIVGCESGAGRRAMDLAWARSMRVQCRIAGTRFFMKQMSIDGKVTDDLAAFPADLQIREVPETTVPLPAPAIQAKGPTP